MIYALYQYGYGTNKSMCDKIASIQTLIFFLNIVIYGITGFLIMAYVDSVCLKFNLYDKAPTHDQIVFNKNDDQLFL